jgi:hypothetical protein
LRAWQLRQTRSNIKPISNIKSAQANRTRERGKPGRGAGISSKFRGKPRQARYIGARFLRPANGSPGALGCRNQTGSMKTPKPSAGSGRAKRANAPAPLLAPRLDAAPQRWPENTLEGRVIKIRGAREHNLKNIDLTLPRDKLVVFTGLSGSGKSSLAFDTIYAEGQRRYVESLSADGRPSCRAKRCRFPGTGGPN